MSQISTPHSVDSVASLDLWPAIDRTTIDRTVPPTSFAPFEKLSLKLQGVVWHFVCQERRIIDIACPHDFVRGRIQVNPTYPYPDLSEACLFSPTPCPPILHVSHYSRQKAQDCYQLVTIDNIRGEEENKEGVIGRDAGCMIEEPENETPDEVMSATAHPRKVQIYINTNCDIVRLTIKAHEVVEYGYSTANALRTSSPSSAPAMPPRFAGLSIIKTLLDHDLDHPRGHEILIESSWLQHLHKDGTLQHIISKQCEDRKVMVGNEFRGYLNLLRETFATEKHITTVWTWDIFFPGNCLSLKKGFVMKCWDSGGRGRVAHSV